MSTLNATKAIGVVVFELPDRESATTLADHLGDRWACCDLNEPDVPAVVVFLTNSDDGNLAELSRRVEGWLADTVLDEIHVRLQGFAAIKSR